MGLLELILPERCIACSCDEGPLCAVCSGGLVRLRGPLCRLCGAPVAWPVERCRECAGRRLGFASARAAISYEGVGMRLVTSWKVGARRTLVLLAADLVCGVVTAPAVDAIAFVPGVVSRELWRGHNPARRLAEELATRWGLPVASLLGRTGAPRPQRGLAHAERRRNVAGSFRAVERAPANVLLIDDVYTTGATVGAAAQALRHAGAHRVDVVTLARAQRGRMHPLASGGRRAVR